MLLLVEDDKDIVSGLEFLFKENNYDFKYALNLKSALKLLELNNFALIILDVTLPDGDGFTFYQEEIKKRGIPTIFLTAKDEEENIVKGLELADDYLTKPFRTKELLSRIKKVLVRNKKDNIIKIKNITFYVDAMKVFKDDEIVSFTALEMQILQLLLLNRGHIVKRDTILDTIWEITGNDVDNHTITVYIKRIKDKLGSDIITTIKGLGYKIDE